MDDFLSWLIANWLLVAQIAAIALVLVLLVVGIAFAVSWYFWRFIIQIEREVVTPYWPERWYGDNTRLPDDYWEAVAREEAKGRAA